VAVALAARAEPVVGVATALSEPGRWAVAAHVLDFDDLHMPSTAHISTVIVPAVLGAGGDDRAYLAGAGVMARLGAALGWSHYEAGWHTTCTSGAPATAAGVAVSLGLSAEQVAHAIALAVPAAGGVQRSFGTEGKTLQVGMAVEAGTRAAHLAAGGARTDLTAVEAWMRLVQAEHAGVDLSGPAVPDGLAVKLYPCCYALQRPISMVLEAMAGDSGDDVERVVIRTPLCTVQPLIHHRPVTGLQGKFSLEYAVATAVLDGFPGLDEFTDAAVVRAKAQALLPRVELEPIPTDDSGLLAGLAEIDIHTAQGARHASMAVPPGSPRRPPSEAQLAAKFVACGDEVAAAMHGVEWTSAAGVLRSALDPTRIPSEVQQ
jgi:2-methylcitrate dehydratase PrpD